jgi:hypothetical protein
MIEKIKDWDTQLFLYLNGLHTPPLDGAMYWITDRLFWIPFYLVIILVVYRHYGLPASGCCWRWGCRWASPTSSLPTS